MSAPDTNISQQQQNHRPALIGIRGAMIFGAAMLALIIGFALLNGSEPSEETLIGSEAAREQYEQQGGVVPVVPGSDESN